MLTIITSLAAIIQAIAAIVMIIGLRHSARSADAAVYALKLSENIARKQLRAYLDIADTEFEGVSTTEDSVATVRIRNFGQTPAINVKTEIKSAIIPLKHRALLDDVSGFMLPSIVLSAGADEKIFTKIPAQAVNAVLDDVDISDAIMIVHLETRYEDIFGEPRFLRIRLECQSLATHTAGAPLHLLGREAS